MTIKKVSWEEARIRIGTAEAVLNDQRRSVRTVLSVRRQRPRFARPPDRTGHRDTGQT